MKLRHWNALCSCLFVLAPLCAPLVVLAGEVVVESGEACQREEGQPLKNLQQIESEARNNAKRIAAGRVATRIKSITSSDVVEVKNAERAEAYKIGQVVYSAYVNADVKELAELESAWSEDTQRGPCFKVLMRVEVIPQIEALAGASAAMLEDPTLPLNVRIWSDRSKPGERVIYRQGDSMRLYIRGNKPFYARVLYRLVDGQIIQLLPNPHRKGDYFLGGITYVIPSGEDDFDLKIEAPFGAERVTVYASEQRPGMLKQQAAGNVFVIDPVQTHALETQVRGVGAGGFSEAAIDLVTMP